MHIKNNYNINNFFVGTINLYQNQIVVTKKGFNNCHFIKINDSKYLSLLNVINDDELLCVNSGINIDFRNVNILKSLTDYLPKFGYKYDSYINNIEALNMFRYLFDNTMNCKFENIYDDSVYTFNDFYVGDLILFKNEFNIDKIILLNKSSALKFDKNNFVCYRCLFYKLNDKFINLNDNQIYSKDSNYLKIINSLFVYFNLNNAEFNKENISLRKSLSLFNKINRNLE